MPSLLKQLADPRLGERIKNADDLVEKTKDQMVKADHGLLILWTGHDYSVYTLSQPGDTNRVHGIAGTLIRIVHDLYHHSDQEQE